MAKEIQYFHEPASTVNGGCESDARKIFHSTLEAYHCQCHDADADDPATQGE